MRADHRVTRTRDTGLASSLVVVAAVALSACNTALGPTPIDRNWHVFDGPRVSFFVRPGSFAEHSAARLSEVIEDQYGATVRSLQLAYAGRVRAFAYDSGADGDLPSDHSGRAYPETESFRFGCVPPLDDNLFSLMSHEANHVIITNGFGRSGTFFLNEGLPTAVLSETFHLSGRHFLFAWTRSHRSQVPPLAELLDDREWSRTAESTAYNTSASFLAWLLDTYGAERLRQIYAAPSDQIVGVIATVYGRPLAALEADWLSFCDRWPG